MSQNFSNHRHTPVLFIVAFLSAFTSAVFAAMYEFSGRPHFGRVYFPLFLAVVCLCLISRQYITRLQDRIIRMEMRYRTDRLLSPAQLAAFETLGKPQMVALRFASDAEMPSLVDRCAKEKLSATDIKKAVKEWQADHHRT